MPLASLIFLCAIQPPLGPVQTPQDAKAERSAKMKKTREALVGKPYPALRFTKGHGTFDEDSLVGKVVLFDFFAHWCGPCIRSFPEMEAMYKDLHPKGLEVIGITKYYGYYGQEKGLTPEVEFDKMGEFMKAHEIPWSVMYGGADNFESYGCDGIPFVVAVDKQGVIRQIKLGYDANHFADFRKSIEALLAEK